MIWFTISSGKLSRCEKAIYMWVRFISFLEVIQMCVYMKNDNNTGKNDSFDLLLVFIWKSVELFLQMLCKHMKKDCGCMYVCMLYALMTQKQDRWRSSTQLCPCKGLTSKGENRKMMRNFVQMCPEKCLPHTDTYIYTFDTHVICFNTCVYLHFHSVSISKSCTLYHFLYRQLQAFCFGVFPLFKMLVGCSNCYCCCCCFWWWWRWWWRWCWWCW